MTFFGRIVAALTGSSGRPCERRRALAVARRAHEPEVVEEVLATVRLVNELTRVVKPRSLNAPPQDE